MEFHQTDWLGRWNNFESYLTSTDPHMQVAWRDAEGVAAALPMFKNGAKAFWQMACVTTSIGNPRTLGGWEITPAGSDKLCIEWLADDGAPLGRAIYHLDRVLERGLEGKENALFMAENVAADWPFRCLLAMEPMPPRTARQSGGLLSHLHFQYASGPEHLFDPETNTLRSPTWYATMCDAAGTLLEQCNIVRALHRLIVCVARLLGLQRAESKVTEAEIRSIIQEGAEDGEVQAVEQQIMGRVFSLGDRTVESIMTHRSELAWIDAAASAAQIRETVARAPHNRYPVGEGSLDKLLGVVCLKDLFLHLGDEGFDLRRLVAPAKFFHEGFEVYNALEQLRTEQLGYGIICDEFGVTRGIITLRDIFEALVGELPDPREEPDIVRREDGSCLVDGQCPFYDFLDWFGLENALPCNAYNTVSGLILDQLAHIPATGEKLEWNGFTFEIVDMDGARIDKILVSQKQQP